MKIRFAILALLVLGAAPDRGPRVVDVTTFGASPAAAPSANRKAFHDAMDYLVARTGQDGTPWGTVYVPTGRFLVDRPIQMREYIGIRGEGTASLVSTTTGNDVFAFGFKRNVGPVDPAHFPDLFAASGGNPVLDSTAISGPGQRFGLRTMADSHLVQQGGALDVGYGDGYRTPTKLTIDAKVDFSRITTKNINQGCLFGMTEANHAKPFSVILANGAVLLQFRTVSATDQFDAGTDRSVVIMPIDSLVGWASITLQIDLSTATVAAWRDGVQLKLDARSLGAGWAPGLRFAVNEHHPFLLGGNSPTASTLADMWGSATDLTFAGLHVQGTAVYKVSDPGSTQSRADGRPITDSLRYFTRSGDTVGYLPLTDRPESIAADRIIGIIGRGGLETTGYWFSDAGHGTPWASIRHGRVENLGIGGVSGAYGRGIATFWTQSLNVRDSSIKGGHQAIGAVNVGANYPVNIAHCELSGSDAAIYLYFSAYTTIDDITIASPTRCGLRFVLTEPTIRDVRGLYGSSEYLVKSEQGGFSISDAFWDDEGSGGASKAAFFASATTQVNPMGPRVLIADCSAGNTAPGRPLIALDDGGQSTINTVNPRSIFRCERLIIYPTVGGVAGPVVLAGDRWSGSVSADQDIAGLEWVHYSGKSGKVQAIGATATATPPVAK